MMLLLLVVLLSHQMSGVSLLERRHHHQTSAADRWHFGFVGWRRWCCRRDDHPWLFFKRADVRFAGVVVVVPRTEKFLTDARNKSHFWRREREVSNTCTTTRETGWRVWSSSSLNRPIYRGGVCKEGLEGGVNAVPIRKWEEARGQGLCRWELEALSGPPFFPHKMRGSDTPSNPLPSPRLALLFLFSLMGTGTKKREGHSLWTDPDNWMTGLRKFNHPNHHQQNYH